MAERFAQSPFNSPSKKTKEKSRIGVRYIFEGEDDERYKEKMRQEQNQIVLSEIDKKERFMAQLTPDDDHQAKPLRLSQSIQNENQFIQIGQDGQPIQKRDNKNLRPQSIKQAAHYKNIQNDGDVQNASQSKGALMEQRIPLEAPGLQNKQDQIYDFKAQI